MNNEAFSILQITRFQDGVSILGCTFDFPSDIFVSNIVRIRFNSNNTLWHVSHNRSKFLFIIWKSTSDDDTVFRCFWFFNGGGKLPAKYVWSNLKKNEVIKRKLFFGRWWVSSTELIEMKFIKFNYRTMFVFHWQKINPRNWNLVS